MNQTGVGQKFAPPKKSPEKETCIDTHENAAANIAPPLPPNFNVVKKTCLVVRTFVRKMPALMAVQNQATLKLGDGGEGETKRKQKMWIEEWCELSSDTSSSKSACHRHEATAKANNGCQ